MFWMPMDEFWISLLTMLVLLQQTTSSSDTTELIGAVGGSVTFRTDSTTDGNAFWYFGTEAIVSATFEDPPQAVFSTQTLKTRFAVSEKGRTLSISQLRLEDAGTYSVTIDRKKRSTFILHVYKELAEPTVTCEAQNCSSDGSCRFSLRCSVSGTDLGNVSYTWRMGDQLWDEGPVLLWVDNSDLEGLGPLTCTAQNPVSKRSISVTTTDLHCTETSTHPPGPDSHSSVGVTIGVIATGAAVMALSMALLLFLRKSRGWKEFRLSKPKPTDPGDPDAITVYAEVGPSQQRIPNGIKAKPMDGQSATTVYSTVKPPDQVENGAVTSLELI